MYLFVALLVSAVVVIYWIRTRAFVSGAFRLSALIILPLIVILLIDTQRKGEVFAGRGSTALIAIASDVSLSMGTMPEPVANGDVGTRLERAQSILIPIFAHLGAATRPALMSVSAFTSKSEVVLAWDDDLSLAREIIEYVLTTGLLTEAGSDIGAALTAVVPLYENLPEAYRGTSHPKFLILVSDGEQTSSGGNSAAALARLQELGVRIIALHVGLENIPEGLPVYDDGENFIGFDEINGQIFSQPDPELMRSIAGEDTSQGLFVDASDSDAVAQITGFIGLQSGSSVGGGRHVAAILLLWGLLVFGLLRWL